MKKLILVVLVLVSIATVQTTVFARKGVKVVNNENVKVELKYAGEHESYIVLELEVRRADSKLGTLRIMDGEGEELYSEKVTGSLVKRTIKISPYELANLEIKFTSRSETFRQMFNLNMENVSRVIVVPVK